MISRSEVINSFLALFDRPNYLEVGVSEGETFFAVKADRKVAVDPVFRFDVDSAKLRNASCAFHQVPSDSYFSERIDQLDEFQVIYLDGLHTFEQTLRDFTNAIRFLSSDGVIVIDDVVPNSYQSSLPEQEESIRVKKFVGDPDNSWMGDTYKLVFFIEAFFPTFELRTTADNHGQAVLWRANPPRRNFRTYSAREIADLQFVNVVTEDHIFKRKACAEIVEEFIRAQRARGRR